MFKSIVILLLVTQLDSPSWRVRDRADHLLRKLPEAYAQVEAISNKKGEAGYRAKRILKELERSYSDIILNGFKDNYPWLDYSVYSFERAQPLIKQADAQLKSEGKAVGAPDWPEYRLATKLAVDQMRSEGFSAGTILDFLRKCRRIEEDSKRR